MRSFSDFIETLNDEEKENYKMYNEIRGKQVYRIVYEALNNKFDFNYTEMNRIIRCDKALKDILYKYLAIIEEMVKSYLFSNYDLSKSITIRLNSLKKIHFNDINDNLIKRNVIDGEITYLYKVYSLTFSQLIKLLENKKDNKYDLKKLKIINTLRNKVMHHYLLFFDENSKLLNEELKIEINALISVLPKRYLIGNKEKKGFIEELNFPINKTKEKTNHKFDALLFNIEKRF